MATKLSQGTKSGISKPTVFALVAVALIVGFIGGTRGQELLGSIAPMLGIKVATGSIDLSSVENTYRNLKAEYNGTLDTNKLIEGASKGLVAAAGDPYTVYMDPEEAKKFQNDLSGTIGGGIGAELGKRNDQITVIRPIANTPSSKANVKAGDIILAVNDESTKDWTVDRAVTAIRGKEGTTVKLTLQRNGGAVEDVTLTREIITTPSVISKVEGKTGILTVSRFDNDTASTARKAAQGFIDQGVTSVIVDLRGNGGGYLEAAREMAGIWLNDKVVVKEQQGAAVSELRSGKTPLLEGVPTIVLVNGGTASASEILAGALQDYGAARLVGEKTFGKGTVQKPIDINNGALLKVTIAKWLTPKGKSISEQGITPDITVGLTQDDINQFRDPQLDKAKASF